MRLILMLFTLLSIPSLTQCKTIVPPNENPVIDQEVSKEELEEEVVIIFDDEEEEEDEE